MALLWDLKQFGYLFESFANKNIAALVSCCAASDKCRVVAALFRLFGGKVSVCTAGVLDKEGLLCKASCSYLVTVVEEKLEGVGCESDVAKTENVHLDVKDVERLLKLKSFHSSAMDHKVCVVCKVDLARALFKECGETKTETIECLAHMHTPSSSWSSDTENHWHICSIEGCTEELEKSFHTWDEGKVTTNPTCLSKGVKTYTCECGQTKTEEIEKVDHVSSNVQFVPAT